MGLEAGGGEMRRRRRRRRKRRRRKFPICVKAYVIDPFGAAAQKTTRNVTIKETKNCSCMLNSLVNVALSIGPPLLSFTCRTTISA